MFQRAFLLVLLTLPWLWPYTYGPSAGVEPYLVALALAARVLALWPAHDAGRGADRAAVSWLAAALLSSLIALLQYFDLETPFAPWMDIAAPGQAFGNLRQPNQLASLLVIGLLALCWLSQAGRLRWRAAAPMGALLVVALAATASRVGLLELLLCGALLLWWAHRAGHGRRALGLLCGALALYALAALVLPMLAQSTEGIAGRDVLERLRTAESTCGSRLILWHNVLHLIGLKPWTGWGWGELDYAHYITLYDGARFCHILDNAHNLPLHLAVELGVPVALAVCALLAWLVWRNRPWTEQQPARQLAWGVLLAIGIHSLVEYPLWYGPFQIAVAICVWLLWATRTGARTVPRLGWRWAAAPAMLCAAAYAGWDYHRVSQIYLPAGQRNAAYRDNPWVHAHQSWLFADVVRFAEVTSQTATRENAAWLLPQALQTLHFSPESRVIIRVIESASLLGLDDLALTHLLRFRAAFPREHQAWVEENQQLLDEADDTAPHRR
jgi:O-antigen ligase